MEMLDARILVVSFASLEKTAEWIPFLRSEFLEKQYRREGISPAENLFARTTFAADPELTAYQAFGLGRHSVLEAYGPRIVWQYLRWIAQGKPLKMTRQDTLQRGGDFVIGRNGLITLSRVGRDQAERPTIPQILAALDA
jgi:hypothetical protein